MRHQLIKLIVLCLCFLCGINAKQSQASVNVGKTGAGFKINQGTPQYTNLDSPSTPSQTNVSDRIKTNFGVELWYDDSSHVEHPADAVYAQTYDITVEPSSDGVITSVDKPSVLSVTGTGTSHATVSCSGNNAPTNFTISPVVTFSTGGAGKKVKIHGVVTFNKLDGSGNHETLTKDQEIVFPVTGFDVDIIFDPAPPAGKPLVIIGQLGEGSSSPSNNWSGIIDAIETGFGPINFGSGQWTISGPNYTAPDDIAITYDDFDPNLYGLGTNVVTVKYNDIAGTLDDVEDSVTFTTAKEITDIGVSADYDKELSRFTFADYRNGTNGNFNYSFTGTSNQSFEFTESTSDSYQAENTNKANFDATGTGTLSLDPTKIFKVKTFLKPAVSANGTATGSLSSSLENTSTVSTARTSAASGSSSFGVLASETGTLAQHQYFRLYYRLLCREQSYDISFLTDPDSNGWKDGDDSVVYTVRDNPHSGFYPETGY